MMKYSVIIPVYGCEKYLDTCVKSILNQKGSHDFEIILVDDGSKDRSGEIADELEKQYSQVKTFHKENGGAASARNYGIQKASGEYLLFIDGDDAVEECLLESVDALLEKDHPGLVIFGMSFDYYRKEKLERAEKLSCDYEGNYSVEQILEDYSGFFRNNTLSSACNKVFRTEIIRSNGLQFNSKMTLYEDYDFVLRYLMQIQSISFLESPFYHYRNNLEDVHLNNRVSDLQKLRINMALLFKTILAMTESWKKQQDCSKLLDVSADLYLQLLIQNLMVRNYSVKESKEYLKEYCQEPSFRSLLECGAKLSEYEKKLLARIDADKFGEISMEFKKKRLISYGKKKVKKVLRALKLWK